MENSTVKTRNSSIELYRIIVMLAIVAHHYVVNTPVLSQINQGNLLTFNSIFTIIFSSWGKTGINCFVLITGYYMCRSKITAKKYLKLLCQIIFYNIIITLLLGLIGVHDFSLADLKMLIPFYGLGTAFTSSFLVFYLLIPFINILIQAMNKKQHLLLIILTLVFNSVLPTFLNVPPSSNYVGWFVVLFLIAAYIRFYPNKFTESKRLTGYSALISLVIAILSAIACILASHFMNRTVYYWFLSDSNKILALAVSVTSFLFFKNIEIKGNKFINTVAQTTFGVLLIHANSGEMSEFIFEDILKSTSHFYGNWFAVHAILSTIIVFAVCALIDYLRIVLVEKPLLKLYDKLNIEDWFAKKLK